VSFKNEAVKAPVAVTVQGTLAVMSSGLTALLVGATSLFGTERMLVRNDQNADTQLLVKNSTSGTLSQASIHLSSSNNVLRVGHTSNTFTTANGIAANEGYVMSFESNLVLNASGGASAMRFLINGSERMRLIGNSFFIGSTVAISDERLGVTQASAANEHCAIFSNSNAANTSSVISIRTSFTGSLPTFGSFITQTSASAVGGGIGFTLQCNDAVGTPFVYAAVGAEITSNTAGSPTGAINFYRVVSGTLTKAMHIDGAGRLLVGYTVTPSALDLISATRSGSEVYTRSRSTTAGAISGFIAEETASSVHLATNFMGANRHSVGTDGYVAGGAASFSIDVMNAGGSAQVSVVEVFGGQNRVGEVVINETGLSTAFVRIEGDTDANLFRTDAINDRVGIGTATPATKLDVAGTVTCTLIDTGSGAVELAAGTYTPTLTNVANVAASTAYQCQFSRVGNTVSVSGKVDVDPTAAASTQLGISLPIASNLGAEEDCAGAASARAIAGQCAAILGDAANNRAQMEWIAVDLTNQSMFFTFSYEII